MEANQRDPQREHMWRETVAAWRASGLSVRPYCQQHGVREASFYYWRRELQRRDTLSASSPAFVPVTVVATATVEVRCPSGHVVSLPNADIETLRQLFAALAEGPSC